MDRKARIRKECRRWRSSLADGLVDWWNTRLVEQVRLHLAAGPLVSVGLYLPLPGEPALPGLLEQLLQRGQAVCLPVDEGGRWTWRRLQGRPGAGWHARRLPVERLGAEQEPGLALVPGLGFDRRGIRLGQGGGVYDRLLARPGIRRKIGIAFPGQVLPRIPADPWDQAMDLLVTPQGSIACHPDFNTRHRRSLS